MGPLNSLEHGVEWSGNDPDVPVSPPNRAVRLICADGLPRVPEKKERRIRWIPLAAVFTVTAGVTFEILISGTLAASKENWPLHSTSGNNELDLQTEGRGDGILLAWNRLNPVVRTATEGILQIDDGFQHREVHLDPGEVANGSVLYMPATGDVTFRLELRGDRGETIKESRRVLNGQKRSSEEFEASKLIKHGTGMLIAASPLPVDVRHEKTASEIKRASNVAVDLIGGPVKAPYQSVILPERKSPSAPDYSVPNRTAVLPPGDPSLENDGSAANAASNAAAKEAESTSAAPVPVKETNELSWIPPSNVPLRNVLGPLQLDSNPASSDDAGRAAPIAKSAEIRRTNAPPIQAPLAPGMNSAQSYVAPQILRQVMPNQIRRIIASPLDIEVEVKLDRNGYVETARLSKQAVKVPLYLSGAVLAAAKQWTFKPATLGGTRVESDYTIVFRIRPTER